MSEMKNAIERIHSRRDQTEDRIRELEDRNFEITQSEQDKVKRMKKSKESLHDLWYTLN